MVYQLEISAITKKVLAEFPEEAADTEQRLWPRQLFSRSSGKVVLVLDGSYECLG